MRGTEFALPLKRRGKPHPADIKMQGATRRVGESGPLHQRISVIVIFMPGKINAYPLTARRPQEHAMDNTYVLLRKYSFSNLPA
jgi:hypothetical protein